MLSTIPSKITGVFIFGLLCFGISFTGWTQGRGNSGWAVGGTRLPFNPFNDSLATDAIPLDFQLGPGGSAVANDPVTGVPLFYADGAGLYDAQGTQQATFNGDASANQPVTVVPVPGDTPQDGNRQYYVFVNEGGNIVYYTVTVNLPQQGAPSVASINGPTATGITGAANAMTIVPNENNSNFWLVTQEVGTSNFSVFDVANLSVVPSAGDGVAPQAFTAANISFSEASGQLAVADAANGQGVRLITIDRATGQLTYADDFGIPAGEAAYDTEWSRDGSKLYVSTGVGGNVYQYNTVTGTTTPISNQVPGVANFGLQRGPDGSVYHIYETTGGEFQLGRINSADSAASLLSVASALLEGANLGGQQFSATLPAGIDLSNIALQPSFVGQCTNNPVQLIPNILLNGSIPQPENGIPDPDSIVWLIDGQRYSGFSPTLVPEQTPSVQATAYWGDDSVSVGPFPLPLQDFQLQVPVVQDTTICPDEVLELCAAPQDGGGQGGGQPGGGGGINIPGGGGNGGNSCEAGNYTYLWSTGATTPDITVDEAGIYWVLVTDPSTGCTAYAESNVKEYQVQNQTYNEWYFGTGGGINFNTLYDDPDDPDDGQITPVGDGNQSAPEGVEAVSDPNGDILFYTDGQTVWFVTKDPDTGENVHTLMPIEGDDGSGIGGSPEATQVVSIPVPGTDAMYYIFTTTAVEDGGYELRYSIVDLRGSQASPGPSVVSSANLLFVKSTERIAIQGGNGGPATLIAHEYGTNNFRAYPITEQGIGNPVISSVGSVHDIDNPEDAKGYMKFGGDSTGSLVAVALDDRVEVFNFDTETLEVSEPVTIDFAGRGQPYGVEFASDSSGNTVMYVSTDNGIYGATIQRPVEAGQNIPVVQVSGTGGQAYGAIQQGPDGQIYVAQPGQTNIGTFSPNPNDPGNVNYNSEALPDGLPNGAVSGLGLPTYVSMGGNSFPEPSISVEDACVGNETTFSATGRDDSIEEYSWQIVRINDDGTELNYALPDSLRTEQTFTFAIDTTGNFLARVTLTNKCDEDTILTQEFIMNTATEVILPESINLCNGSVDLTAIDPAEDDGSFTFQWVQRGAVGGGNLPNQNTISADEEGYYSVTVTNAEGCVSEGEILVIDNRPDVELPEDFTLCQGDERELDVEIPSPGNPGYEWNVLNEAGTSVFTSNEPILEVSETTPDAGIYTYTVTVTDDAPEGCFVQDTVVVTIQEAPAFTATPAPSDCGASTGGIDVNITSDAADTYTYTITDNGGNVVGTGSGLTFSQGNLPAGVYQVTVTNAVGCSTTESVGIDDQDVDYSAIAQPVPGCENDGYFVVTFTSEAPTIVGTGVNYTLRQDNGTVVASGSTGSVMPAVGSSVAINIPGDPGLAPGLYDFEFVGDNGLGCIFTLTNQEIPEPDSLDFSFVQDPVQGCGVTATIAVDYSPANDGNWTFRWFNEDGSAIAAPSGQATLDVAQSGTYLVEVTNNSDPTLCPSTQEIDVYLNEPFDINIETVDPDNSCETGERQLRVDFIPEEAENRDLIYTWTLNGNPIPNATRTITVTATGDYGVRVRERNSACFATDLEPVNVNQPLSVGLFYGNACADGRDIALFADVRTEGTDSLEFAWFNPAGERIPAGSEQGDTLLIRPDFPEGEYRVVVTSLVDGAVGCSTEAAAGFVRNPVPVTNLGGGPFIICPRDPDPSVNSVLLQVGAAPEIYWTTPKGDFVNTIDVLADQGGTYIVEVVNKFGCSVIDSVEVIEDCSPRITAPNAFRPGGVNADFFVYHKYVSTDNFDVKIYNRWGEIVFQSNDRDFRWDGTYNGREAPLGTYPYVIRYKADTEDTADNIREERGGVTIIR